MAESMFEKMADSLANVMAKQSEVDALLKVLQKDFQAITGIGVAPISVDKVKRTKGAAKKDPNTPKRKYTLTPEAKAKRDEMWAAKRAAKAAAQKDEE